MIDACTFAFVQPLAWTGCCGFVTLIVQTRYEITLIAKKGKIALSQCGKIDRKSHKQCMKERKLSLKSHKIKFFLRPFIMSH